MSQGNIECGRVLKVHGQALLGMVGYDSLIQEFFELLRSELTQRSLGSLVHVSWTVMARSSPRRDPVTHRSILIDQRLMSLSSHSSVSNPDLRAQSLGKSSAISPRALSLLVSHMLFYELRGGGAAPIIAGLEWDSTPTLCTQGENAVHRQMHRAVRYGRLDTRSTEDESCSALC